MNGVVLGVVVASLAGWGALARGDDRRLLWGLAAASVPLVAGLWTNVAALPNLSSQAGAAVLGAGDLWTKFWLIALAGVVPAVAAWILVRPTAAVGEAAGRSPASRLGRASRSAGVTLAAVAAAGGSVAFLGAVGGPSPPVDGLWSEVTPELVVGLSLAAAVAEELLFRGVLLHALSSRIGWTGGAAAQAGLFGVLHAGYGDLGYVLAAGAFGLAMAGVVRRWGLLAAVAVHAQVNLVILGWSARGVSGFNGALVVLVLAANAVLAGWGLTRDARRGGLGILGPGDGARA